jgi:hypothetical protein
MQEEDIQRALAQISNGDTAEAELLSALTKLKQFKASGTPPAPFDYLFSYI